MFRRKRHRCGPGIAMPGSRRIGRAGQAVVEFALVFLLLLGLILGLVEFSRMIWAVNSLAFAVRKAVRYASVHGAESQQPAADSEIATLVKDHVVGIADQQLAVAVVWDPNNRPGSAVEVTASHNFKFLFGWPFGDGFPIRSSSRQVVLH